MNTADRNLIIGALDSLGVALAAHNHKWTSGERAIYEEAVKSAQAIIPTDAEPIDENGELNAMGIIPKQSGQMVGGAWLTCEKARHIAARPGWKLTGFVLTHTETKERGVVDQSAVRWIQKDDFFNLMHPPRRTDQ